MTRKQIRDYARMIFDEVGESPLGLEKNTDLNILINLSLSRVEFQLLDIAPWAFRKTFLISLTANKRTYDIATDLLVTDFFIMEDIYYNETGKEAMPLFHVQPDQIREFTKVGDTGTPRVWSYEEATVLAFDPIPSTSKSSFLKAYYFKMPHELNDDSTHNPTASKWAIPDLPVIAHPLVALDTVLQYCLISGQDKTAIEQRFNSALSEARQQLSLRQGTNPGYSRPNWPELDTSGR